MHDSLLRQILVEEYSAPLQASSARFHDDLEKVRIRSLAKALVNARNLPPARKKDIEEAIAGYCSCEASELTIEKLQSLSTMETR